MSVVQEGRIIDQGEDRPLVATVARILGVPVPDRPSYLPAEKIKRYQLQNPDVLVEEGQPLSQIELKK